MIQPQTCLRVADNSGAKKLMCIRILGSNRRYGYVGDVIIGVVKDATPNLTVNDLMLFERLLFARNILLVEKMDLAYVSTIMLL